MHACVNAIVETSSFLEPSLWWCVTRCKKAVAAAAAAILIFFECHRIEIKNETISNGTHVSSITDCTALHFICVLCASSSTCHLPTPHTKTFHNRIEHPSFFLWNDHALVLVILFVSVKGIDSWLNRSHFLSSPSSPRIYFPYHIVT